MEISQNKFLDVSLKEKKRDKVHLNFLKKNKLHLNLQRNLKRKSLYVLNFFRTKLLLIYYYVLRCYVTKSTSRFPITIKRSRLTIVCKSFVKENVIEVRVGALILKT